METSKERYIPALGYKLLTPLYDPVVAFTCREKTFKSCLLERSDIDRGHRVLDLGCGTGTLAVRLKRSIPEGNVVCIDGDRQVLSIAKQKAEREGLRIRFSCCLSSTLPFPDRSFDRVLSSFFFHHLTRDQKVSTAREVLRVLRPGGQFHVADWGKPSNRLMRFLFYSIQFLDGFASTIDNLRGQLPALFEECGFHDLQCRETFSTIYGTIAIYSAVRPDP